MLSKLDGFYFWCSAHFIARWLQQRAQTSHTHDIFSFSLHIAFHFTDAIGGICRSRKIIHSSASSQAARAPIRIYSQAWVFSFFFFLIFCHATFDQDASCRHCCSFSKRCLSRLSDNLSPGSCYDFISFFHLVDSMIDLGFWILYYNPASTNVMLL